MQSTLYFFTRHLSNVVYLNTNHLKQVTFALQNTNKLISAAKLYMIFFKLKKYYSEYLHELLDKLKY